jgi:hypothetical protein
MTASTQASGEHLPPKTLVKSHALMALTAAVICHADIAASEAR